MKGDFTRLTFRQERHYGSVRLQQGRVLLDADWNEEHDILAHRIETETRDVVGLCGAPLHAPGFHLVTSAAQLTPEEQALAGNASPPAGPLLVSAGRCYVDGILAENERIVSINAQPDLLPASAPLVKLDDGTTVAFPPPVGTYFAYLDVWHRHVTALEDELLRERALGGPDTATRTKTVWQVKLVQVPAGASCSSKPSQWTTLVGAAPGTLQARTVTPPPPPNPCSLSPSGGYRRLENQLYRVEIHSVDNAGNATWKWSRDNGAIVARWLGMGATTSDLKVTSVGRDETERFAPNDWVELIDDERELQGLPGIMVQMESAAGDILKIKPATAVPAGPITFAGFVTNPKVRRWGPGGVQAVTPGTFVEVEGGVQVRFAAGALRTGDYWTIPARTAVSDIEWPFTTPQRPFGIRHHYCLLGVVVVASGGALQVTDCRKIFPPLTELPAGADLKKHNRYLHGWGVVCGLQVHCGGATRETVQVEKGYAIACDGTDIFVDSPQQLPIVERAAAAQLIDANGNGKVCITLAPGVAGSFALDVVKDEITSRSFQERVLEGTLLKDVIDDCVRPLAKELSEAFAGEGATDGRVVDESARNRVAAVNLFVQFANQAQGERVFLSRDEHERLLKLYERLRGLLKSRTFCAIQDDLPQPPAYPFNVDTGIGTFYGKGAHRGLRVSLDGTRAYAFGAAGSNRVLAFDVSTGEAIAEAELPLTNPTVQDVLPLGRRVLAVATNANGSALFLLDSEELAALAEPVNIPGRQVVRLFGFSDERVAFAIVRGEGMVRFDPSAPAAEHFAEIFAAFNATGHLASPGIAARGPVYAGAGPAGGAAGSTYSQVAEVQLAGTAAGVRLLPLVGLNGQTLSGDDAIECIEGVEPNTGARRLTVQAVVRQPGSEQRQLLTLDVRQGNPIAQFMLNTDGRVALAATLDRTVNAIAFEESYHLTWVGANATALNAADVAPLQVAPSALAIDQRGNMRVVLAYNAASPSVTTLAVEYVLGQRVFDMRVLADYRAGWMTVLNEILRRLLQRLKDCVCEHLLVDCPTCDERDRLILACVEIRAKQVYMICNFHRREVVTFPKLFYWLSAVPVIPLVTNLIESACCAVLARGAAGSSKAGGSFASARVVNESVVRLQTADFAKLESALTSYLRMTSSYGGEALLRRLGATQALDRSVGAGMIVNRAPATAKRTLADAGVHVARVVPLEEAFDGKEIARVGAVPVALNAGDRVDLYTRNGKVVFYAAAKAATTNAPAEENVMRRLGALEAGYRDAIAKRDAEIAALRKDLAALRTEIQKPPVPRSRTKSRGTPK